jgi:hypothetical protein
MNNRNKLLLVLLIVVFLFSIVPVTNVSAAEYTISSDGIVDISTYSPGDEITFDATDVPNVTLTGTNHNLTIIFLGSFNITFNNFHLYNDAPGILDGINFDFGHQNITLIGDNSIEMNGATLFESHGLNFNCDSATLQGDGTLTITGNSNTPNSFSGIGIEVINNVTFESGTYNINIEKSENSYGISLGLLSYATITGGTFNISSVDSSDNYGIYEAIDNSIAIYGGTFNITNCPTAVGLFGDNNINGTFVIVDCNEGIVSDDSINISGGTYDINTSSGACIGGKNGTAMTGTININNATITATASNTNSVAIGVNGNTCNAINISGTSKIFAHGGNTAGDINVGNSLTIANGFNVTDEAEVFLYHDENQSYLATLTNHIIIPTDKTITHYHESVPTGWSNIAYGYLPDHTVTFDQGSHGSLDTNPTIEHIAIYDASIVPELVTDTGYQFTGWLRNSNSMIYSNEEVENLEILADEIFTAQYTELVTSVKLNQHEANLSVGEKLQLNATVEPSDLTTGVIWTSSDDNICTVDQDGNVKAIGVGTCEIIATADDSAHESDACQVTVTNDPKTVGANVGFIFTNENESPLANCDLTLYSTPVTISTDSNGYALFSDVEYATHHLYVDNQEGTQLGEFEISIEQDWNNSAIISSDTKTLKLTISSEVNEIRISIIEKSDGEIVINEVDFIDDNGDVIYEKTISENPKTGIEDELVISNIYAQNSSTSSAIIFITGLIIAMILVYGKKANYRN